MNAAETLVNAWLSAPKRYPPFMIAMAYDPLDYKFPFAPRGTPKKMRMDVTRGKRKRIAYLEHCARVNRQQADGLDETIGRQLLGVGESDMSLVDRRDHLLTRAMELDGKAEALRQ